MEELKSIMTRTEELRPNQGHGNSYVRKFRSICRFLYVLEVASSPGTDQQNVIDVQWQTT